MDEYFDLVIIGGGPAGYGAALYGVSAGLKVALVERDSLGGTCLNRGCIPAKAYLETAAVQRHVAHAAEFGGEVPSEPLLFLKPSTAVAGPGDAIPLPAISRRVDYEGELAVVIGVLARRVPAEEASRVILGYTCANDVTLRDLQKEDTHWIRAKGFDGSCPLGPWIETDLDPNDVAVETRLNGEVVQAARTSEMVFGVATLIEYVTRFMTLLPGDVLITGTPEGVGRLSTGDRVEVAIEGIGTLANPVGERV